MHFDSFRTLILDEQTRSGGRFIDAPDVDAYLEKLAGQAEFLSNSSAGRCRGLVAFYCNDQSTRRAFITLVLVHPEDRGLGIGAALVSGVLELVRRRGFTSCGLEVDHDNSTAMAMYRSLGFAVGDDRGTKLLMEIAL